MSAICSKLEKCRRELLLCSVMTSLKLPVIESLTSELNTAITQPKADVGDGSVDDTVEFQTKLGAKDTKASPGFEVLGSPLVPADEEGDAINNSVDPRVESSVQLRTVWLLEDAGTTE